MSRPSSTIYGSPQQIDLERKTLMNDRKTLMNKIIIPVLLTTFTGAFVIVACKFQSEKLNYKHAGMQTLFIFFGEYMSLFY